MTTRDDVSGSSAFAARHASLLRAGGTTWCTCLHSFLHSSPCHDSHSACPAVALVSQVLMQTELLPQVADVKLRRDRIGVALEHKVNPNATASQNGLKLWAPKRPARMISRLPDRLEQTFEGNLSI